MFLSWIFGQPAVQLSPRCSFHVWHQRLVCACDALTPPSVTPSPSHLSYTVSAVWSLWTEKRLIAANECAQPSRAPQPTPVSRSTALLAKHGGVYV